MSDYEEEYVATEYQGTVYDGSEDEMEVGEAEAEDASAEQEAGPSRIQTQHDNTVISENALLILQEQWPSWKAARGKKRQRIWRALLTQIRCLKEHLTLENVVWDRQVQVRKILHVSPN
jgi:hypothetical protein